MLKAGVERGLNVVSSNDAVEHNFDEECPLQNISCAGALGHIFMAIFE